MSTLVGIDIGASAIKCAVLHSTYRKLQVVSLTTVELSGGLTRGEAIAQAVRLAVGERGGAGDSIAAALPGTLGTVRVLELPATAQKQLSEVLPFELESALPFDVAEAVFDFRVLPARAASEAKAGTLSVLVAVARTESVRALIDDVQAALGAEPERVEVGAFPIVAVAKTVPDAARGTVAFVDIGTDSSDILVMSDGEPVFSRTVSQGTRGLPQTASKLARELRMSIGAYRSVGGDAPREVYLCGGGAFVTGAESFLSSALGVPVAPLPAVGLDLALVPEERIAELPRYAKALGLAFGLADRSLGVNLRRGALAFERGFAWLREKVPVLAGLTAVLLVSFLLSTWAQLYAKSKEREVLEAALSTVTKETLGEETASAERANELLAQATGSSERDPLPHADGFDVMLMLSEAVPSGVQHDIEELDVQKGHVVVHGVVSTIPEAQGILASLEKAHCVSDAKITRTTQVVGGERQKYALEFDLRCPEDEKVKKKAPQAAASASAGETP